MKKIILSLLTLLSTSIVAQSQPSMEVSAHSRHVWRGQIGPSAISIQPDVRIPIANAGTSVGIWGQVPIQGGDTEIDFTVSQEIGEIGTLMATSYYYDGPLLEVDSHDIELSFSTSYAGVSILVGRFLASDKVKNDTWLQVGYDVDGINVFAGVGDGAYVRDDNDMGLVVIGASMDIDSSHGASLIYNADIETPFFVVRKKW